MVTLQEVQEEENKLKEQEKEILSVYNEPIPQRRFGSGVTSAIQSKYVQRKQEAGQALQQISEKKKELSTIRSQLEGYEAELAEYNRQKQAYEVALKLYRRGFPLYAVKGTPEYKYLKQLYESEKIYLPSKPTQNVSANVIRPEDKPRVVFYDPFNNKQGEPQLPLITKTTTYSAVEVPGIIVRDYQSGKAEYINAETRQVIATNILSKANLPQFNEIKPINVLNKPEQQGFFDVVAQSISKVETKGIRGENITTKEAGQVFLGSVLLSLYNIGRTPKSVYEILEKQNKIKGVGELKTSTDIIYPVVKGLVTEARSITKDIQTNTDVGLIKLSAIAAEIYLQNKAIEGVAKVTRELTLPKIKDNVITVETGTAKIRTKYDLPGAVELDIPIIDKLPRLSFKEQAELAGSTQNIVSASRDFFEPFVKEVTINKPPTRNINLLSEDTLNKLGRLNELSLEEINKVNIDIQKSGSKGILESQLFFDPFGRLRTSRLLSESKSPKLIDYLTEDLTFSRVQPQVLLSESQKIEPFPKGLNDIKRILKESGNKMPNLTKIQQLRLIKFQLSKPGSVMPVGFITREAEFIASGIVERVGSPMPFLFRGEKIELYKIKIKPPTLETADLIKKAKAGIIKDNELKILKERLSKETGMSKEEVGSYYLNENKLFVDIKKLIPKKLKEEDRRIKETSYDYYKNDKSLKLNIYNKSPKIFYYEYKKEFTNKNKPYIPRFSYNRPSKYPTFNYNKYNIESYKKIIIEYPKPEPPIEYPKPEPPIKPSEYINYKGFTYKPPVIIKIPELTTSIRPSKKKSYSDNLLNQKGYKTFVKKGGKVVYLSGLRTKGEALRYGERVALGTLRATFGVKRTAYNVKSKGYKEYTPSSSFRSYKIAKGKRYKLQDTFIQKLGTRLRSTGERQEIKSARSRR